MRIVAETPRCLLLVAAVLALAGCPSDDDDDDTSSGDVDCSATHDVPIEFTVGTGDPLEPIFEPLPADGTARLFAGSQGGYHVYLQVRARGLCPNRILYTREIREPEGTEVLRSQTEKIPMVDGGGGTWVLPRAQPTFVCPSLVPGIAMAGRDLDFEVTLEEDLKEADAARLPDGPRSLTQHVTLHPTCDASDTVCQESTDIGCAAPP